jgi:hypothetical protein
MPTVIIALCEATLLCTGTATHRCRISNGRTRSRPIPVCEEHRGYLKAQAAEHGQTVTEEVISGIS